MKDSKDISIYVHIPFCVRKCLYCDFNSGKYPDYMIDSYIDAILKEMDENREVFSGKSLKAVYIGGGTPSSVPPSYIGLIFDRISDIIPIEDDTEITIEINPGTTTDHKIKDYVSYGVNRVSVGLQSAVDSELEALGRIHTYNDFLRTYDILKENGIKNINVDIMTSIPHQTKGSLLKTLQEVISLHPQHISAYSLSIEKGTPFYEMGPMRLDLPAENESYEIYKLTQKYLKEHGYSRYEI
ncbi:MAG: radical SAM family heme chaperone HemW, partial [Lachnospiraceae bacterium]|nr:radical SAM family heme chaperone HemW [Lachnospiraceae bacterium]